MAQAADTAPRTPPKVAIARPGKIPTLPQASTIRGDRVQPTSAK
jgi:hypothetical protein